MAGLLSDASVIERVLDHIDNKTTDLGEEIWHEPVENYRSTERFAAELELLKRLPIPFCPSAALPDSGSYVARAAAGTPLWRFRANQYWKASPMTYLADGKQYVAIAGGSDILVFALP